VVLREVGFFNFILPDRVSFPLSSSPLCVLCAFGVQISIFIRAKEVNNSKGKEKRDAFGEPKASRLSPGSSLVPVIC
jgi:hypothetical protein